MSFAIRVAKVYRSKTMFDNLFRLDGKVAVVTGAGNGLGRSFALGFAAFGATVICADRNLDGADETASLAKQSRGKAEAAHVDVADEASVDEMWKTIADDHGRIDILINNAGIATNSVAHPRIQRRRLGPADGDQPARRVPHHPQGRWR